MARINYSTVLNLAAEICKDTVPIYAHSDYEQEKVFDSVKYVIEKDRRLKVSTSKYRGSNEPDWVKYINIVFAEYDKYFSPIPYIRFDKSGCLCFEKDSVKGHIPVDLMTLQRIIDDVFDLLDENNKDKLKKQKVRDLKTSGIIAKLNEMAKEDGFKFYHHQIHTRVKLTIELPEKKLLRIDVPFSKFQEVMQEVRPFIKTCRELAATGLGFAIEKDKR